MDPTRSGAWRCPLSFESLPGMKTPPSLGGITCSNAVEFSNENHFLFLCSDLFPFPQSCHCALPWRVWLWLYQWQLPITHPILVLHQDFGLVLVKLWGSWHLISWEFQLPLIMPSSISFIPWLDITGRLAVGEFRIIQVINRDVKQMINSYWFPEGTQWETRQHSVFMVT